jgi:alkanesulfonate monooxygenase SsuD/methylene tetrahydromethanopterin reductase-like flavin-dependent oxidoreductase (luciferase family)
VTIERRWHRVTDAGINPLPVQRPIPIWMGGHSDAAMRRAARVADGWMWSGNLRPGAEAQATIDTVGELVAAGGRDPAAFGIEGRVVLARLTPDQWPDEVAGWRTMRGVTHLCVDTMRLGLGKPDEHVDLLRRFKDAAGLLR